MAARRSLGHHVSPSLTSAAGAGAGCIELTVPVFVFGETALMFKANCPWSGALGTHRTSQLLVAFLVFFSMSRVAP